MSANIRQLQLKAKSLKNIQKLTNSMKMVAATRFKQAERLLVTARPIGVSTRKFYDVFNVDSESKPKVHYLVPFTSDRGLCGSCHFKTCKAVSSIIADKKFDYHIVCVGEKAKLILGFKLANLISLVVNGIGHKNPTFKCASSIAFRIMALDSFSEGTFVYCRFVSSLSFQVKQITLFSGDTLESSPASVKYEVANPSDIHSFAEFSMAATIFSALAESYAVELFSRMNAMTSASKNAGNIHQKCNQSYNRARQSMITSHLIDIVNGAAVVATVKRKRRKLNLNISPVPGPLES